MALVIGLLAAGESTTVQGAYFKTISFQVQQDPSADPYQMEPTDGMYAFRLIPRHSTNVDQGLVPLPKSVHPERIEENADVYGFEIDQEDVEELETDEYSPCTWDPTTEPL